MAKNITPVDIGAMPNAGSSEDGKVIFFDFAGHDGVLYKFKVTHEAVSEIVENLLASASAAEQLRSESNFVPGATRSAEIFKATSYDLGLSKDGAGVVLAFNTPGRRSIGIQLEPELCTQLVERVHELSSKWVDPDHSPGKPN